MLLDLRTEVPVCWSMHILIVACDFYKNYFRTSHSWNLFLSLLFGCTSLSVLSVCGYAIPHFDGPLLLISYVTW